MHIDDKFMEEVGLSVMPPAEKKAFMEHAEEELQVRVGQGVGAELTDEQMQQFDSIDDISELRRWLDVNLPSYREIIQHVYQNFKQEILSERANILGTDAA